MAAYPKISAQNIRDFITLKNWLEETDIPHTSKEDLDVRRWKDGGSKPPQGVFRI